MKKLCAIICLFFISGAQVLAASTKIYDENGLGWEFVRKMERYMRHLI